MMTHEIITPFGRVSMLLDGREVEFDCEKRAPHPNLFPDVDGVYRIAVNVRHHWKTRELKLQLTPIRPCETDNDSDERLECIAIYSGTWKMSMGCYDPFDGDQDYDVGHGKEPRLTTVIFPTTKTERFEFGVCWINNVTEENEIQTLNGADPGNWKYIDLEENA